MSKYPRNYTGTIATSILIGINLSTAVVVLFQLALGTVHIHSHEAVSLFVSFASSIACFSHLYIPWFSIPSWRPFRYAMVWFSALIQAVIFLMNINRSFTYFSLVFALIFFVYAALYSSMDSFQSFRIEKQMLSALPAYAAQSFQPAPVYMEAPSQPYQAYSTPSQPYRTYPVKN